MKKKLIWLFVTKYGRYALGIILTITGVFSEYSTIDFLRTDWRLFEYTCMAGITLIVIQLLCHVITAIYLNAKIKEIKQANAVLKRRFKADDDFKRGYVSNIAMAFKDEHARIKKEKGRPLTNEEIHDVANTAAENFLDLWMS